jgi:hypothetical protein
MPLRFCCRFAIVLLQAAIEPRGEGRRSSLDGDAEFFRWQGAGERSVGGIALSAVLASQMAAVGLTGNRGAVNGCSWNRASGPLSLAISRVFAAIVVLRRRWPVACRARRGLPTSKGCDH